MISISFVVNSDTQSSDNLRLDTFLAEQTGKSRAYIQEQIRAGLICVNGKSTFKTSQRLKNSDQITGSLTEEEPPSHLLPVDGKLEILYEDEHLLLINKRAGVVVHPGAGQRDNTLVHFLLHYLRNSEFRTLSSERPGIVHRLDQGTSGVILVAKNRETQESLSGAFKNRLIKKTYEAIAWGKLPLSGTFNTPIGRDSRNRKKMSSQTSKSRSALTRYRSLERFRHFTHVELSPETGRTHQLRVHLSESGHPIVGDPTYGREPKKRSHLIDSVSNAVSALNHTLLHARSLSFTHPVTGTLLSVSANLPDDFKDLLGLLKEQDSCPE